MRCGWLVACGESHNFSGSNYCVGDLNKIPAPRLIRDDPIWSLGPQLPEFERTSRFADYGILAWRAACAAPEAPSPSFDSAPSTHAVSTTFTVAPSTEDA